MILPPDSPASVGWGNGPACRGVQAGAGRPVTPSTCCLPRHDPDNDCIDKPGAATVKWRRSTVSRERANRECGAAPGDNPDANAAAAPATVSGEPKPLWPLGLTREGVDGHRAHGWAPSREPGDLPSIRTCAGRGASAAGRSGCGCGSEHRGQCGARRLARSRTGDISHDHIVFPRRPVFSRSA